MKNLEINADGNLGFDSVNLVELDRVQLQQTNGGLVWYAALAVGVGIASAAEIIRDWDNFKAGLTGTCEK